MNESPRKCQLKVCLKQESNEQRAQCAASIMPQSSIRQEDVGHVRPLRGKNGGVDWLHVVDLASHECAENATKGRSPVGHVGEPQQSGNSRLLSKKHNNIDNLKSGE